MSYLSLSRSLFLPTIFSEGHCFSSYLQASFLVFKYRSIIYLGLSTMHSTPLSWPVIIPNVLYCTDYLHSLYTCWVL